jgi:hypothetical protein
MIFIWGMGRAAWAQQKLCPDPGEMEKLFVLELSKPE